MRYVPTQSEIHDVELMSVQQRTQYFLTRTLESEEVWALADYEGWVMREEEGNTILQIWPYQQLANLCIKEADLSPHATSLDHFVENVLQVLVEEGVLLEILPSTQQAGALLPAGNLLEIFKGMMETGEYFLEG